MIRNEILSVFSSAKWFRMEFRVFLSSAEWFGTKLQSYECFSFLRNSSGRNSEPFCLPQNGSEQNSERLPLRETGVIPRKRIKIYVCSVFRGINFSRKMATLTATQGEKLSLECYYTSLSPSPAKTFSIFFIYFLYWVSFRLRVSHFPFPSETCREAFGFTQAELSGSGVRFFRFRQRNFPLNCACFFHT
jgi:hypothetical protein